MLYRVTRLREQGRVLNKSEMQTAVLLNLVWQPTDGQRGGRFSRFVQAFVIEGTLAWQRCEWSPLFNPEVVKMDEGMAIVGVESHVEHEGSKVISKHEHIQVWWCERPSDADVDRAHRTRPTPKDYGAPGSPPSTPMTKAPRPAPG